MLFDDVHIDALGVRLGDPLDLADAVADGRYAASEYTANALLGARVSAEFPPDLAVAAGRPALARSTAGAGDVRLLLHATSYFQGQDMWTPASYIQQHVIGGRAPAIDVDQKSNGGLAALDLAASYLTARPAGDERAAVLVTTGERFCPPGFDRFKTEAGTVMSDSGTAVVLTRRPAFARVLSIVLTSDSTLEGMYRGRSLRDAPAGGDRPLNMRARKSAFLRGRASELADISKRVAGGIIDCLDEALAETKTDLAAVRRFVLPNIGQTVHWWTRLKELGVGLGDTTWHYGRTIGHLGAGDQVAGLHHLVTTHLLAPGDRVVLAGSGYGFNWGCAVLEILRSPEWSRR